MQQIELAAVSRSRYKLHVTTNLREIWRQFWSQSHFFKCIGMPLACSCGNTSRPLLLTFYIAKREMLSFQAIQTQGIEIEEDSTRRAGKPACFFARCYLYVTRHTSTCIMPVHQVVLSDRCLLSDAPDLVIARHCMQKLLNLVLTPLKSSSWCVYVIHVLDLRSCINAISCSALGYFNHVLISISVPARNRNCALLFFSSRVWCEKH